MTLANISCFVSALSNTSHCSSWKGNAAGKNSLSGTQVGAWIANARFVMTAKTYAKVMPLTPSARPGHFPGLQENTISLGDLRPSHISVCSFRCSNSAACSSWLRLGGRYFSSRAAVSSVAWRASAELQTSTNCQKHGWFPLADCKGKAKRTIRKGGPHFFVFAIEF